MSDEGVTASIGPPALPEYLRSVYANQVNVNFTPHDIRIIFSLLEVPLQAPVGAAEGFVQLEPTAVASVVVPATLMHALIGVLQQTFSQYLEQFGPPGLDPEGPGVGR